jgi:hypothetical protein
VIEPQPFTIQFRNCYVRIFNTTRYLETVFNDGTKVPAAPQDTDSYRAQAQDLGYGDDTWSMCRDHEIGHTLVSESFGEQWSRTLWAVAHGNANGIPDSPWEMAAEEGLVLAWQRWRRIRKRAGHAILLGE